MVHYVGNITIVLYTACSGEISKLPSNVLKSKVCGPIVVNGKASGKGCTLKQTCVTMKLDYMLKM